ncbi:MAG TPA: hypothetical protein VH573_18780 [Mycobacteriales bacterium]|jgi:hypothetical protein
MRRPAAAVLFVLLGLVATGCADAGSGSAGAGAGAPTGSSAAPPTPVSSTAAPTPSAPVESGSITVDGVVEHGVEPGCLVLRTGSKSYLLLRSDGGEEAENVPVAVPIRVQGDVITGIASYCQQGTPLLVRTVTRR